LSTETAIVHEKHERHENGGYTQPVKKTCQALIPWGTRNLTGVKIGAALTARIFFRVFRAFRGQIFQSFMVDQAGKYSWHSIANPIALK